MPKRGLILVSLSVLLLLCGCQKASMSEKKPLPLHVDVLWPQLFVFCAGCDEP